MEGESIFDQEIVPQYEDNDFIPMNLDENDDTDVIVPGNEGAANNQQPNSADKDSNNSDGNKPDDNLNPNDLVFNDDLSNLKTENEEEKLINELKSKGFDVVKRDENEFDTKTKSEIELVSGVISKGEEFIQRNDQELIKIKFRNDKAAHYKSLGRENYIDSEEFNIEVEAEVSRYEDDPYISKILANNIRQEIKELVINPNKEKLVTINQEIDKKYNEKRTQNKLNLQESLKKYHSSGFLNQKPDNKIINEVYQDVISGNFAKSVKDSPDVLVEFALFQKYRNEISEALGGGTYGKGVADAVKNLTGKDKTTHFGSQMNNNSSGARTEDKKSSWTSVIANDDPVLKDKMVI